MKKNYLKNLATLFITALVITSCTKETLPDQCDDCRLTSITSDFGDQTFKYNQRGLLDEWYISNDTGYYKLQYNAYGRLIKSRFYKNGDLEYTIIFFYRYNRVVKETWYKGNTTEKWNEIFYHFDSKGLITRAKSVIQDYYIDYLYTAEGNVLGFKIYEGGSLVYFSTYTYLAPHHKSPYSAVPGIDNGFVFTNSAVTRNKWYSTSQKFVAYDEAGNAVVIVDQDPTKTIREANQNNFVTVSNFYDKLTKEYAYFRFKYENCGTDVNNQANSIQEQPVKATKIDPLLMLRPGSAKSMKEQVADLRKILNAK